MFREDLMGALKSAVNHLNGGADDNTAVVKAASEFDFNPDQTQRLVETYNTAKTCYFFKSAADRRADFPLADPSKVLPALFTPAKPAAKKEAAGLRDYSFYNQPAIRSSAVPAPPVPMTTFPLENNLENLSKAAYSKIRSTRQLADRCHSTGSMCTIKYGQALDRIAGILRQNYHIPDKLASVEHGLWEVFGKELAEPVITDLVGLLPPKIAEGRANPNMNGRPTDIDRSAPEIVALFKEAMDSRFGIASMAACEKQYTELADSWEKDFLKAANLSSEVPPDPFDRFFPTPLEKSAQGAPQQKAQYWEDLQGATPRRRDSGGGGGGGRRGGTGVAEQVGAGVAKGVGAAVGKEVPAVLSKVMSGPAERGEKAMSDRIRNLQRQLILEELIAADPVLKGEDPNRVVMAYQTLMRLAPEVSLDKEITRSVLRTATQAAAVSPFDAKTWAELENEIKRQLEPPRPRTTGAPR